MRILQFNTVINRGSTGRIAEQLGLAIQSRGWESLIAYGRGKPTSSSELSRVGTDSEIAIHVLMTRLFDAHTRVSKRSTVSALSQLEGRLPNLIHLHNVHDYYLNLQALTDFINENHIPAILTLHDCWTFTGHCAYYDYVENARLLYAADICVAPGEVGLTAIHSLSFGTPVITHNQPDDQMPEYEAITPHVNGSLFWQRLY